MRRRREDCEGVDLHGNGLRALGYVKVFLIQNPLLGFHEPRCLIVKLTLHLF